MTESMAVKLPAMAEPAASSQPAVVLPASSVKPPAPDVVKSINDILDPPWEQPGTDADKVLSPGEALDEARRRIRQMRVDLENNVEMVTRSFEHSVFQLPPRTGLPTPQLFDEPVLPDEDEVYPVYDRPTVDLHDDLSDATPPPTPAVVVATPVLAPPAPPVSPELDAIADAIEAALDSPGDVIDRDLAAMVAAVTKRATTDDDAVSVVVADAVTHADDDEFVDVVSLADAEAEPVPVDEVQATSTQLPDLGAALLAEAPVPPQPPSQLLPNREPIDDAEASFLSDLLSTLDEVEATVTQLANTTALDDVLAKYSDILNSDTSHTVTEQELAEAREVQRRAAETRTDLDAMLRTLKAAAETFAVDAGSADVADAAAVLEDLLATAPEPAAPEPAAPESSAPTLSTPALSTPALSTPTTDEPSQSTQPPRLINQVVLEPILVEPPVQPGEPDLGSLVASALRPLDLPPMFRGEPKRPVAQQPSEAQPSEAQRRLPPKRSQEPFPPQSGGPRADTPEESEIDRIIEAAAERSGDERVTSFWDDDDIMTLPRHVTTPPRTSGTSGDGASHTREETVLASSQPATSQLISEQAASDHSLELVIMRDEIRDLRDRLDSSQKLVEDLMLRLANLTEIALQHRSN